MPFEAVIGLEVHAQLATASKLFCRCPNRFGAAPNHLVCPVCLGYPGTLPRLNRRAVELAVRLALALSSTVHERSGFDRKSYFYPDLPKGYQITQHRRPLATGGRLPLPAIGAEVEIERLHLEEDAGRLQHWDDGTSGVDFNRCGVPLVEVVTAACLARPDETVAFLEALHQLLVELEVSDGSLEEGSLRCDANVSLRRSGSRDLGSRVELKNLGSLRGVGRALAYEIERLRVVVEAGGAAPAETRRWDEAAGETRPLRDKEESRDYRYLPEPDLPPLVVDEARRLALAAELPELPWERHRRLLERYQLSGEEARQLAGDPALARYFESAARATRASQHLVGWLLGEVKGELGRRGGSLDAALPPKRLGELVELVADGTLSRRAAKQVLAATWESDEAPAAATERLGLARVADRRKLLRWAAEVVQQHPEEVAQYRRGKEKLLAFFTGRLMALSQGRADPRGAQAALRRELAEAELDPAEPLDEPATATSRAHAAEEVS